ncbi:MAG: hypothetical protein KJ063_17650 [Anaerolineae bacterium]|nr:hypothetical protein [Anaerolineae bacterium]
MANPFGMPGITVQQLAEKREAGEKFILLDVREDQELWYASLDGAVQVALSELSMRQLDALPDEIRLNKEAEVAVLCHHGNRSAQVTAWLRGQGWGNVVNIDGGIDAYAALIDPSVGRY